jgi:hypothetical protein
MYAHQAGLEMDVSLIVSAVVKVEQTCFAASRSLVAGHLFALVTLSP